MNLSRSPGVSCNQCEHRPPMIAIIAADDCERLHIAMAAAIRIYDRDYRIAVEQAAYVPAAIRDAWLERTSDLGLHRRVTALANAGVGSLQGLPAYRLAAAAVAHGVPLPPDLAERMAEHFAGKREAVLTYDR